MEKVNVEEVSRAFGDVEEPDLEEKRFRVISLAQFISYYNRKAGGAWVGYLDFPSLERDGQEWYFDTDDCAFRQDGIPQEGWIKPKDLTDDDVIQLWTNIPTCVTEFVKELIDELVCALSDQLMIFDGSSRNWYE